MKRSYVYGGGLFDSIFHHTIKAVTSTAVQAAAKEAAKQIATKAATEAGNRLAQKAINKIIPPPKGKGLNAKSKAITEKYGLTGAIPIEQYVKR